MRQEIFLFSEKSRASLILNGYGGYFTVVKRPEREVNHSPASSAEGKNGWICNSTHFIRLHVVGRKGVPLILWPGSITTVTINTGHRN